MRRRLSDAFRQRLVAGAGRSLAAVAEAAGLAGGTRIFLGHRDGQPVFAAAAPAKLVMATVPDAGANSFYRGVCGAQSDTQRCKGIKSLAAKLIRGKSP